MMVRKAGLEPACLSAPPPQDGVSANSTTSALIQIATAGQHFIIAKQEFAFRLIPGDKLARLAVIPFDLG
jgi:hypothetical protein